MSDELEELGRAFIAGRVPEPWSTVGFLSLKPLASWVADLRDRVLAVA